MKTITFFKRVLASAALVSVCGFACATNNGKQFIHNDTMEGGKLVYRKIYAMNDAASGILNPVKMYKYSYDTDQQKTVKSTYAWNIFKNTWETESRTVISRYETETSVEYSVWNKEKGSFDLSKKYIFIIFIFTFPDINNKSLMYQRLVVYIQSTNFNTVLKQTFYR